MESLAARFIPIKDIFLESDKPTRAPSLIIKKRQDTREKTTDATLSIFKKSMEPPVEPERAAINNSFKALKKSLAEAREDSHDYTNSQISLNETWDDFLDRQGEFTHLQATLCLDYSNKEALTAYQKSFEAYTFSFDLYRDACENCEDSIYDYTIDITQSRSHLKKYISAIHAYAKNFKRNRKDLETIEAHDDLVKQASAAYKSSFEEYDDIIATYDFDEKAYNSDKIKFEINSTHAKQIQD